jgi:hypothetical protein
MQEVPYKEKKRQSNLQEGEATRFQDNLYMKLVRLPYSPAAFTPQEIFLVFTVVRG